MAEAYPRILLVDLSRRYGGASARALILAQNLHPWHVAIAGLDDSPVINQAAERGIPIHTLGKSRANPLLVFRIASLVRREGFDVVDTQNIQSKFWSSLAILFTDARLVSTLNSSYEAEYGGGFKGRLYAFLDLRTNWRTARFIAVSDSIGSGLVKSGLNPAAIHVIRNSIQLEDITRRPDDMEIRRQIGIPRDGVMCLAVGRLVWAKGYEALIDAFKMLAGKHAGFYLAVAGDGELRESLTEQIRRSGLTERIFLLGFCDSSKVKALLRAADIFVMPSRTEGIPYALLEAAAFGLPIVASRCGGIPEVVTDGMEALLVPVGDPRSLSDAMFRLGNDRDLSNKLGAAAREKMRNEYSLQKQIEAVRLVFLSAMAPPNSTHTEKRN